MKFNDLHGFVELLEANHQLVRVSAPISPALEITEVVDRVCKGPAEKNKALLFENVVGSDIPVLINLFGTAERMAWALHVSALEELSTAVAALIDMRIPKGIPATVARGAALFNALQAVGLSPKKVKRAPVQEVVETEAPSLDPLPILTCWPGDGGPFITLPQVITRDPLTGVRNVGMYRLQKVDSRTLLVHWQRHKGGAEHEREALAAQKTTLPAAIVLGSDPACIWAASAPLPPDIDEYLLAGWLRGRPVEFVDCVTQPLEVPAQADIVIEGEIDLADHRPEGPFGDHTGYYTPVEPFPVFHVTAVTRRRDPFYPATVVGVPPMEDAWMGKATERLFLPLLRLFLPEVVDFSMPAEGVFHNLVLVSIKKRYPGQARKVMYGLWGLALLSLAKAVVVVDEWVDVQNPTQAAWQALGNVDWSRDVVITTGPVDHLDHASAAHSYGGKIGIDATAKLPEEGHARGWPEVARMSPEVQAKIAALWEDLGL
ncbi:MAG: menaquinone biosynthesis decarboxylase [Anaerolineae bacterium]|jgi:4-hydroxy-3-polyprenylbenzoate decarboxylase|nr:menaquinone biosynthesis decarboxylase [Anaerolineae bacterium]